MEEYTNRELGLLLVEVKEEIKKITKCIEGNGHPGLLTRMNNFELWQKLNEPIISELDKGKKRIVKKIVDALWKIAVAVVIAFLGWDRYSP